MLCCLPGRMIMSIEHRHFNHMRQSHFGTHKCHVYACGLYCSPMTVSRGTSQHRHIGHFCDRSTGYRFPTVFTAFALYTTPIYRGNNTLVRLSWKEIFMSYILISLCMRIVYNPYSKFDESLHTTKTDIQSLSSFSYCRGTHWGRVTHICLSKLTIIGSDNGVSPD